MTQQITSSTPTGLAQTLEVALAAWLHEKVGHTSSQKTRTAYQDTITAFRTLLQGEGLDLAWEPREGESEAHIRSQLALYAQAFASTRLPSSRHQGPIAPATKNQRLSILSSFYRFATKRGFLSIGNPIDLLDRSPVQPYARASGLAPEALA